ncbi:MAG: orotidine-5'-phosphate decarboxylase [Propionibacteriaceae bacterium]|jgi:orotidine-5'-phosphate decarboxylase|nr:orotidine-5'-phosphate decarboxylase [Propionibacteriaceae bacterium]
MTELEPYAVRLRRRFALKAPICVGLDPHPALLRAWGLSVDPAGLARFGAIVVEALADRVACLKPQSAFFEAHGAAGLAVLEETMAQARQAGALVVLDVKRGDIGSTMTAYAEAYLGDGPLAGDAVTLSPYLGFGALSPALDLAEANGRGVYLLVRTSNPEGGLIQSAVTADGVSVAQSLVDAAAQRNRSSGLDAVGLVLGATHADLGVDLSGFSGSVLAPGVGAQGGSLAGARRLLAGCEGPILPALSRQILRAGPDRDGLRAELDRLLESDRPAD